MNMIVACTRLDKRLNPLEQWQHSAWRLAITVALLSVLETNKFLYVEQHDSLPQRAAVSCSTLKDYNKKLSQFVASYGAQMY